MKTVVRYIGAFMQSCILIEDHAKAAGIPVRFAAAKLAEGGFADYGKSETGPE